MTQEEILQLTDKLYKLTLAFPKKEPLRYKLREAGLECLTNYILWQKEEGREKGDIPSFLEKDLSLVKNFLLIVQEQNWTKKEDVLELLERYEKIEEEVNTALSTLKIELEKPALPEVEEAPLQKKEAEKSQENPPFSGIPLQREQVAQPYRFWEDPNLDKREKKILRIVQEKKKIQIGELSKRFPQISRRTLLRNLDKLIQLGYIIREGEGRGAFYRFLFEPRI